MYQILATELIKEAEGFVPKVYKCPAGFNTIGYGYNIDANPLDDQQKELLNKDGTISKENAFVLLLDSIPKYEAYARELVDFDYLNDARKALMIDLVYNLGKGGFEKFRATRGFINMSDYNNAWKALRASRWFKQVGNRGIRNCAILRDGVVYTYADIAKLSKEIA